MSAPAHQTSVPVPVDQDFSFLRAQPHELRRGMLERARNGAFLENFRDRTPEERIKVAEWQDNMATFLEVMEERDLEAKRAELLLKLACDLLDQGEIKPALRRVAREYTDALRDATTFECPVRVHASPADAALTRWLSGPPPPLRFPPGPAHLLSLFDYALRRATGRVPNPGTTYDDLPDLIAVPDSSDEEGPFNPELARLTARRDLLDHFAERVVQIDDDSSAAAAPSVNAPASGAHVVNVAPTAGAPLEYVAPAAAPATAAANGVIAGVADLTGAGTAPNIINHNAGNRRRRRRRATWVEVTDEDA